MSRHVSAGPLFSPRLALALSIPTLQTWVWGSGPIRAAQNRANGASLNAEGPCRSPTAPSNFSAAAWSVHLCRSLPWENRGGCAALHHTVVWSMHPRTRIYRLVPAHPHVLSSHQPNNNHKSKSTNNSLISLPLISSVRQRSNTSPSP